ncbi:hypothetical protein [Planococcus salinarum]|uniref:hypothetical protein n=1 Tax=Planococcus salinarum TaxID=622695 RepID=UPI000E3D8264|nr:hypothetical protein [Planococcus salinarum]TAA73082.1 hypothetical protein D2909_03330 [Planococcus salinarum]
MEELIKKLAASVASSPDVLIRKSDVWRLPVVLLDVSYDRVKRLKMDILMKMLLFAFQQSEIRRAAVLADMLSVEELFISDLIHKMKRTGLIGLGKKGYVLTPKGYDYLEKGIFEEALDGGQALISFSAAHDEYRMVEVDSAPVDEKLVVYRYAVEAEANRERMLGLLSNEKDAVEESFQILVSGIADVEELDNDYVACIEFQLYDQEQDILFARIWNSGTGEWDETLEKQVEERELVEWREVMKAEKAEANQ